MFSDITFYVKGKTIEVNEQDFLLGELTESCLNINDDQFHEVYFSLKKFKEEFPTELPEQQEYDKLKEEVFRIDSLLREHKIFQVLGTPIETIKAYFENKSVLESWDMFCQLCNEYNGIIIDFYSFNVTINCFIVQWIRNLKKCTPDDYAAAYYDFFFAARLQVYRESYL